MFIAQLLLGIDRIMIIVGQLLAIDKISHLVQEHEGGVIYGC